MTGLSLPSFWLGMMLILLISFQLGLLPVVSATGWQGLILPAATLRLRGAVLARLSRSALIEILQQEYVRTAWAKGLPGRIVVYKHALRNALIPLGTMVGLQFGALLSGAVIVERIWPGRFGSMAVQAILSKDFPVVQGTVLVLSLSYLLVNLAGRPELPVDRSPHPPGRLSDERNGRKRCNRRGAATGRDDRRRSSVLAAIS